MTYFIPIKVESHSGYKADEYPVRFTYGEEYFDIRAITDRWYQGDLNPDVPPSDYFKVETCSGKQFILRHDLEKDLWFIVSAGI
jgi:hypothetical protein